MRSYTAKNARHRDLAGLGKEATAIARDAVIAEDFPARLADRRAFVREALGQARGRIDQALIKLLEEQSTR